LGSLDANSEIIDVIDMNQDGHVDLVLANVDGVFSWKAGDGENFAESVVFWAGDAQSTVIDTIETTYGITVEESATFGAYNPIWGDFNNDGAMDLVQTVQSYGTEVYWTILLTLSVMDDANRSHSVPLVDTNHLTPSRVHSILDDRLAIFSNAGLYLYEGGSFSLLSEAVGYIFMGHVIARDLDEDGDEDWYILHDGGYGFVGAQMLINEGGTYTSTSIENPPFSHDIISDEDEVWIPSYDGLYFLDTSETWQQTQTWDVLSPPVLGDFGGDGHLDVLVSTSDEILTYYGDGVGGITEFECTVDEFSFHNNWIRDINGDGKDDIVEQKYNSTSGFYDVTVILAQ
jgi:hypothetical protein